MRRSVGKSIIFLTISHIEYWLYIYNLKLEPQLRVPDNWDKYAKDSDAPWVCQGYVPCVDDANDTA